MPDPAQSTLPVLPDLIIPKSKEIGSLVMPTFIIMKLRHSMVWLKIMLIVIHLDGERARI